MAAVTLAQLMDPLTKIQAATETTADAITGLVTAMATQGTVGDAVQSAILKELQLQTALLKKRNSGGGLSSLVGGSGAVNCGAAVFSPTNLNQHQNGAGLEFHHMEWV